MNTIGMVIAVNLLATFVIFCGLKLFDLGSNLADLIRKYGPGLSVVFVIVAIFNFLLKDTLELLDGNQVLWMTVVGMIGFAFLEFVINLTKHSLLDSKSKKKEVAAPAVAVLVVLDIVLGAIAGATAGISFTLNFGTGIVTLCALILLQIIGKVAVIRRYQDAYVSRRANIAILSLSLLTSPVVAILVNMWARARYHYVGIFMALAVSYLAYLGIYQLIIIVKKFQNR